MVHALREDRPRQLPGLTGDVATGRSLPPLLLARGTSPRYAFIFRSVLNLRKRSINRNFRRGR
jgi:hypothetical protein